MNRAWYITLEYAKRAVKIEDTLDDETYRMAIQAASDAMPVPCFVQTRTIEMTAPHPHHILLRELGLLSVTTLEVRRGNTWQTLSPADYTLEPAEAPYLMPPRPYWKISRAPSSRVWFSERDWAGYSHGYDYRGPNVRITGKWGTYDLRRQMAATLVAPDNYSEIQRLTPGGTISGGSFTLRFGVDETAPINWAATAGDIQTALEALPSIGAGNIAAAGGPIATTVVTLTFQGALANQDVAQIEVDDMNLTGAGATLTASTFHAGSTSAPVSASAKTITLSSAGEVETGHTLHIDDEDMFVTAVANAVCTVDRAVNGTDPAEHGNGSPIEIYTYPSVDQACLLLVQRYASRSKDAPFGIVGSIDGFMRLAINDPDVLGLIGKFMQQAVA